MIGEVPLLRVRRHYPRPSPATLKALRSTPTGFLVDCMEGRGGLEYSIKPIDPACSTFLGVAITCQAGPADNLAVVTAVELAQEGDVVVASTDGFRAAAVAGDLMLGIAKNRGVVGFVTDGLVRDIEGILAVGLPTFCSGVTPNSPHRKGPGTVGCPIAMGGVAIEAGDIVAGDRDGVVIVPRNRVPQVIQKLVQVRQAEAEMVEKVRAGLNSSRFARDLLETDSIEYLD